MDRRSVDEALVRYGQWVTRFNKSVVLDAINEERQTRYTWTTFSAARKIEEPDGPLNMAVKKVYEEHSIDYGTINKFMKRVESVRDEKMENMCGDSLVIINHCGEGCASFYSVPTSLVTPQILDHFEDGERGNHFLERDRNGEEGDSDPVMTFEVTAKEEWERLFEQHSEDPLWQFCQNLTDINRHCVGYAVGPWDTVLATHVYDYDDDSDE